MELLFLPHFTIISFWPFSEVSMNEDKQSLLSLCFYLLVIVLRLIFNKLKEIITK